MGVVPHAPGRAGAQDRGMAAEPLRISIEIDRDPDGLRGRVREVDTAQEFVGWLGLLGALAGAIDRLPPGGGP